MAQYTEEQDQAWIDGRTTPPEPTTPAQPAQSIPQVRALQHAVVQLREARY